TGRPDHLAGHYQRLGKIVKGGALHLVARLYRLLNLTDEAANSGCAIAAELLQRHYSVMPASGWTGSGKGGEIGLAVGGKNSGIDVRIAVVPETGAITQHGVVVNIENGEWPEQRPDPAISAVAVAPPALRGSAVAQPAQRCNCDDLPARRRVGKPGLHGPADALRPERSRPCVPTTGISAGVTHPPERQARAYRHSRDPDGIDANPHPGRCLARQQGRKKSYDNSGNSNAPLRHGTLPRKPRRVTLG